MSRHAHCDRQRHWHGVRHYVGARLHRRLFFMMGLAIFVTFGAAATILHITGDSERKGSSFRDPVLQGIEVFFSQQFADVWHQSGLRAELAERAGQAFHVGVSLRDTEGNLLGKYGEICHFQGWSFPVQKGTRLLGRVGICPGDALRVNKSRLLLGFGAAGLALWIFSGLLARKLSAPLIQLSDVTREIGEGRLSARARLGRGSGGEVGQLARSINEMASRIERQLEGQRELLAGVSHEIRTPLSRLRVLTEILRERNVDEKYLQDIEREVWELDDLTGQLLASSRLDFDQLDCLDLDLIDVVEVALQRTNYEKNRLHVSGTPGPVVGDATLIGRALVNLVENATRHGEGLQEIRLVFEESEISIVAVDTGPGFQSDDLDRAFEPFFRGKYSGKGASSLGLGLALVARIARAHGGAAFAKNLADGGAEVGFTLSRTPV